KEAHQRAEQERSAKEAHQRAEQERSAKEAHQRAEQERKKEKIFTFKIIGSLVASFLIAIIVDLQVKNKNNTSQKVLEANSEAYSTTENDEANSEAYSTTENDEANSEAYSTTENDEANSEAYSTIESHEPKLVEYSKIENLKVEADRNAEKENIKSTDSPIKIDTVLLTKAMTDLKDLLAKNWNGDLENSITNEIENCYNNNANKKYCYYLDTSAHIVFERIVSASEGKMEMPQIFLTEPTYKRFLIFYRSYNLETHVTIGELQTSVEDLDILIQSKLSKVFSN
ncbi:hypothetical protein I2F27_12400, partial [Acinetobacter sp. B5B]|uniref:hypothetical protein n=1 Tax=Acinetobacter baretiae TaxID=2605383 RepID=UPI001BB4026C